MKEIVSNNQFSGEVRIQDIEHFSKESPVVSGQALTGAELFRRQSSGLPVGCAVRQFNKINPYLEKFSIYDNISAFKLRHGMLDSSQIEIPDPEPGQLQPDDDPTPNPSDAS